MKTIVVRAIVLTVVCMMLGVAQSYAQETIHVKGTVTSESGEALIGVRIKVVDTATQTMTDVNGHYTLQVQKGKKLEFSYMGYIAQVKKVTTTQLNVILKEDQLVLEESIVMAYSAKMIDASPSAAFTRHPLAFERHTEEYHSFKENRFVRVSDEALSTFSIDVDAAAYSNMRRFINQGEWPQADAIRTEELVNYFSYSYKNPTGNTPVAISTEIGVCPWNVKHRLVRIGLKAKEIDSEHLPASNFVFLIDVSGSMDGPTRLELVKSSLKLLINNLRAKDRVAIVVYAGSAGEVLPSTPGNDVQKIREALDKLQAGGSTAGGAGIKLAYQIAKKNFITNGNNRIILCSDGDFNVGVSSENELETLIEKERKTGVFLTVLGYGMGNYKDNRMQVLAQKGNGNHAYIDNLQEANKVLVNEFGSTMHTVAKDVKLQIEFNPAQVQAYRLIGYESRLLDKEDFNNDLKDAGEIGAGHTVTALYEVVPVGVESDFNGKVDGLKYQQTSAKAEKTTPSNELLTIKLRYKQPDKDVSRKIELAVMDGKSTKTSADFRFASAVAMLGQLLRNSDYKGDASFDKVISLAKTALDNDEQGYRREFVRLVETAKGMAKE